MRLSIKMLLLSIATTSMLGLVTECILWINGSNDLIPFYLFLLWGLTAWLRTYVLLTIVALLYIIFKRYKK